MSYLTPCIRFKLKTARTGVGSRLKQKERYQVDLI